MSYTISFKVCSEDKECEFLRFGPSQSPEQQEVKLAINSDGSHSHQGIFQSTYYRLLYNLLSNLICSRVIQ